MAEPIRVDTTNAWHNCVVPPVLPATLPDPKPPMPAPVRELVEAVKKLEALDDMYGINVQTGNLYEAASAVKALYREDR